MKLFLIGGIVLLALFPSAINAQTTYDLNRAKLTWSWSQGTGGVVDGFKMKCGIGSGTYTLIANIPDPTAREFPVRSVITGSGGYYCVVTAFNGVGESPPSNEIFFVVGVSALSPGNLGIGY